MEQDMTRDEVQAVVNAPGFDAYGGTRIYAIWQGQIVSVKSQHDIDRYAAQAVRFYAVTRASVPIRHA